MTRAALLPSILFVAAIVAANYVTSTYGMIAVGLGLTATAGTYLAGVTFVLRDTVQDLGGLPYTIGLILTGAAISYLISDPFIALASGAAFLASELADLTVYTPLRAGGYVRAAIASNVVGSFIDTVLFLWIAGFPIWSAVPGQMLAKLTVTAVVVAGVVGACALLREPVRG